MLPYQTISRKEHGISIVGIGGAGSGILQCFAGSSADNVKLYTASLDERVGRALGDNVQFIQLGGGLNHGLGSGGDPDVGRRAAEESREELEAMLENTRLLVMVAGLGGGTGSGAAPVLARMAQEKGVFLVTVLLMPFSFEGKRRREQADKALAEISCLTDILFCFENDYMENLFTTNRGARAVFEEVDRLLAKATAAVPMLASSPGLINLGLDELATALENNDSRCLFGSGKGYGANRAEQAARSALESPLVAYRGSLQYARTVIVHVAGGENMSLHEIRVAVETVKNALADEDVNIFFGTTVKPHLGDEIRVTIIASVNSVEFHAGIAKQIEEEKLAAEAAALQPAPEEEPVIEKETDEQEDGEEETFDSEGDDLYADEPEEEELEATSDDEETAPEEEDEQDEQPAAPEQKMHQGELTSRLPASNTKLSADDQMERARRLFAEVDAAADYAPSSHRGATGADNADAGSLRHHDLRSIFPD